MTSSRKQGSNNTNKLSPQEQVLVIHHLPPGSNNTNKLSPQEHTLDSACIRCGSNNTNKLSPQEPVVLCDLPIKVQIIQINLVLKNSNNGDINFLDVQIIQINLVLKNWFCRI